jgi:hypothetical protein
MAIELIPATDAFILEMSDCGRRAFENDALDHAIFPPRAQDPAEYNDIYNFRLDRIRKRIQSSEWVYVLATSLIEGQTKVLGYAGYMSPPQEKDAEQGQVKKVAENEVEPQANAVDAKNVPESMDMEAYKYAMEILEKAKKEIVGGDHRVWCKLQLLRFDNETTTRAELFLT